MERYTPEQITEVLRLHKLWLDDEKGGVRANLVRANLVRANLVRANLDGANLYGANLVRANLYGANLVRANLDGANLDGANLDGANLYGANLVRANLYGANLDRANLDGANLDRANLDGANLVRAKNFSKFISIGPIGSRYGYTYAYLQEDKIRCGCFTGTLQEFEKAVKKTHKDQPLHLAGYLAVVAMVKAVREAQPAKGEATPTAPAPFAEGQLVKLTEPRKGVFDGGLEGQGRVEKCSEGWTRVRWQNGWWNSYRDELLVSADVAEKAAV